MSLESLNTAQFDRFVQFATEKIEAGQKKAVARISTEDPLGGRKIEAANPKFDSVGKIRRSEVEQMGNNHAREIFKNAVAEMFGGENNIPDNVKKAMILDDYGKGKPLTARRIMAVKAEVDKLASSFNQAVSAADKKAAKIYANLDANQRQTMVNAAVRRAAGDKIAMEVVAKCIDSILRTGAAEYRSVEQIEKKVDTVLAGVAELRKAAKGNQAVLDAGKTLLVSMNAKRIQPGVITEMVNFAMKMDTSAVRKLNPNSSGLQFHKAVKQLMDNVNDGVNTTSAKDAFEGADELDSARIFICDLHFAKCSNSTLNKIHQAMESEMASKVKGFYNAMETGGYSLGDDISEGHAQHVYEQGVVCQSGMNRLNLAIQTKIGVPEGEIKEVEIFDGEIEADEVDGNDIRRDMIEMGRTAMEAKRQEFLNICVNGNGPGADAIRDVFSQRIGPEPYDPGKMINDAIVKNSVTMLGWNIMSDCKKFALGDEKDTMFFKDVNRLKDVTVGDVKLSNDFETAKDQIAAFVTKNAKTTYAALDPQEKTKAHVVMSLISQETAKSSMMGSRMALDKDGKHEAFETVYKGKDPTTMKFAFRLNDIGGLEMEFSGEDKMSMVMSYGENGKGVTSHVGEGSNIKYGVSFTLRGKTFERLSKLDFKKFDDTNARQILIGNNNDKLDTIYDQFPKEYRVSNADVICNNTFDITIN